MSAARPAALLAALALAGCAGAEPAAERAAAAEGRREVRAPIVSIALRVAESHPPQYFADVVSALPDGCTQLSRYAVRREGSVVFVDVFNTVPADRSTMCTMIYGEKRTAVALGSDFLPGAHYTLDVNGTRRDFTGDQGGVGRIGAKAIKLLTSLPRPWLGRAVAKRPTSSCSAM